MISQRKKLHREKMRRNSPSCARENTCDRALGKYPDETRVTRLITTTPWMFHSIVVAWRMRNKEEGIFHTEVLVFYGAGSRASILRGCGGKVKSRLSAMKLNSLRRRGETARWCFRLRGEDARSCASLAHAYLTRSQTVDSVNCVLLLLWGRKGME